MKKVIAFLMITALILTLCGCDKSGTAPNKVSSGSSTSEKEEYEKSITLLYSKADTFNPYTAKTEINRQLCKLLYEPLVKTDDNFEPHNSIAKSVKISKDVCTVVLKDVKFSDGTRLTADDVVYSYKLAKKSKTAYKNKLYAVESVSAKDSSTVVFTLEKRDPYFANVLDFPIIKSLWTSSFVCFAGGLSLLLFALFYYIIDVKGWDKYSLFFTVIGMNSITIYVLQWICNLHHTSNFFFEGLSVKLAAWYAPLGDLVLSIGYVTTCWLLLWVLYKKRIFLKI